MQAGIWTNYRGVDHAGLSSTKLPGFLFLQVGQMVSKMGEFLSGAIAFEFSMENNEYGLVITPGFLSGQDSLQMFQPFHHKMEHCHFFYFQKLFDQVI